MNQKVEQRIPWYADLREFSPWARSLRNMLLASTEIANAPEQGGRRTAILPDFGEPTEMAESMRAMARVLRDAADTIDTTALIVESAKCRTFMPGTSTEQ